MAEQIEAAVQVHGDGSIAAVGKGGEKDAVFLDQLRVVVVHHQHGIQLPRKRSDALLPADDVVGNRWGHSRDEAGEHGTKQKQ